MILIQGRDSALPLLTFPAQAIQFPLQGVSPFTRLFDESGEVEFIGVKQIAEPLSNPLQNDLVQRTGRNRAVFAKTGLAGMDTAPQILAVISVAAQLHRSTADAAENLFGKRADDAAVQAGNGPLAPQLLHLLERFPRDDGLVGVWHDDPFVLGKGHDFFGFVAGLFVPPLHKIARIGLVGQNGAHRGGAP